MSSTIFNARLIINIFIISLNVILIALNNFILPHCHLEIQVDFSLLVLLRDHFLRSLCILFPVIYLLYKLFYQFLKNQFRFDPTEIF